ncbi:hypothetical protein K3W72_14770, partial [Listeria monocytogenes]|nr:hypothetical protein [Listeria monocytogenes]
STACVEDRTTRASVLSTPFMVDMMLPPSYSIKTPRLSNSSSNPTGIKRAAIAAQTGAVRGASELRQENAESGRFASHPANDWLDVR